MHEIDIELPPFRILQKIRIGHHRGPSPMDIVIALTAAEQRLTLLHADGDFASVAKVRPGMAMIRIDQL